MNNQEQIINWNYRLPRNCSPIENFLLPLKQKIETAIMNNQKLHIILDGREVDKISMNNKMKMDAFWKRYKKQLAENIYFTTIFVDNEDQQKKLEKIYQTSNSTTPYKIFLYSEYQEHLMKQEHTEEVSNNVVVS